MSENAPRAIRGGLTGLYQLFIATGVYSKKSRSIPHAMNLILARDYAELLDQLCLCHYSSSNLRLLAYILSRDPLRIRKGMQLGRSPSLYNVSPHFFYSPVYVCAMNLPDG